MSLKAVPWTRPLKAPFEEVFLSLLDGTVYRWNPMSHLQKATRLCIPADEANDRLGNWNEKHSSAGGNPWSFTPDLPSWTGYFSAMYGFVVAQLVKNAGTSIKFHAVNDYGWVHDGGANILEDGGTRFNWVLDKANNKFQFEFFLDNDLEETSPSVINDDGWAAYWNPNASVTESDDTGIKAKGANSYKLVGAGGRIQYEIAYRWFSPHLDISSAEFICIYVYGANSGLTFPMYIYANAAEDYGNFIAFNIVDNFTGWKRFVFPLNNPDVTGGSPDLSEVFVIQFLEWTYAAFTIYFDRLLTDVGQWVKAEAYVPDLLDTWGSGDYPDTYLVKLYSWTGSAWDYPIAYYDGWNYLFRASLLHALNGDSHQTIYGLAESYYNAGAMYAIGERGEIKGKETTFDLGLTPPADFTYSAYYGCKKRIGFAIKLPPDDGQDSSTTGISQCKLKLEVYYAGSGKATYEFENGNSSVYGLTRMNESWLVAFDATTKKVEFLILSKRPTGLEVRADENELIDRVDLTLAKGTRVFAGELTHGLLTRDADGDGVPDFLSGGKPTDEVAPIVVYEDQSGFWTMHVEYAGSYGLAGEPQDESGVVKSGTISSKQVLTSGSYNTIYPFIKGSLSEDFSDYNFLAFYWYGGNSGDTIILQVWAPDWSNRYKWTFADNFTGWKKLIFAFDNATITGSPDISDIIKIEFIISPPSATPTYYLDRMIVDKESPIGIPYIVSKMFKGGYP